MRGDFDEDELDDDDFDDTGDIDCLDCDGDGWIVTCCDDLCRGQGWCMHGDGDALCHCNRNLEKSYAPDNAPREWKAPKDLRVIRKRQGGETP